MVEEHFFRFFRRTANHFRRLAYKTVFIKRQVIIVYLSWRRNRQALERRSLFNTTVDFRVQKAILFCKYMKYRREAGFIAYQNQREMFRGSLRIIFPVRPSITQIHFYSIQIRDKLSGHDNLGLMIFEEEKPKEVWGRDLDSIFLSKNTAIKKILDVDLIDAGETIMEEISDYTITSESASIKDEKSECSDQISALPEESTKDYEYGLQNWSDIKYLNKEIPLDKTEYIIEGEGYISSSSSEY
ncbi:unnamed protein product [Moneuplotes crassus]|uniref:Uncharacterized protein n=1 Tax=Euplotes crassus TaxID=5936 RepID=A0AAD2CZR0_EUPCR|nr:unnamed protein product [Moneuplotes crassus]